MAPGVPAIAAGCAPYHPHLLAHYPPAQAYCSQQHHVSVATVTQPPDGHSPHRDAAAMAAWDEACSHGTGYLSTACSCIGTCTSTVTVTTGYHHSKPTAAATCVPSVLQSHINALQSDISADNSFLNVASRQPGRQASLEACSLAQPTNVGAANEPIQLSALTPCIAATNTAAASAAHAIPPVITQIPGNLSVIQADSKDHAAVECAVDAIDYVRCNYVLPDVQAIFSALATQHPVLTNVAVKGPHACPVPTSSSFPSPKGVNLKSCGPTATSTGSC